MPNQLATWGARIGAVASACLLLAACGGSRHAPRSATSSSRTSAAATSSPSATTSSATPATPIATAAWTLPTNGLDRQQVSLFALRRDGPYLVLTFGVRCVQPASGCAVALGENLFQYRNATAEDVQGSSPSGVVLVDPAAADVYQVAQDSRGFPFASAYQQITLPASRGTQLFTMRFAQPPSSTTAMDVAFPAGGPLFADVPITSGAAPALGPGMSAPETLDTAPAFSYSSTTGVTLPVAPLSLTAGTDAQYETSTQTRSSIALRGDVLFHFDKSNLTPNARGILHSVAAQIRASAQGPIQVTGYTDDIGTPAFNLGLSQRRAASVVAALTPLTPGAHYASIGDGESDPVATNDTPGGRALNRRVTVSFAIKRRPAPTPTSSSSVTGSPGRGHLRFTAASGDRWSLAIASAQRAGQLLRVELDVTCVSSSDCAPGGDLGAGSVTIPPQPGWQAFFRKGEYGYVNTNDPTYNTASGFSLLNPVTGQALVPVTFDGLTPLTSTFVTSGNVPAGHTFPMWAYYPAPASATAMTLRLIAPVSSQLVSVSSSGGAEITLPAGS